MRAMSWLRNILKVASSPPSSSTPNFGGEDRCHSHGDSEDESSTAEDCDEGNGVIGAYSYPYDGNWHHEDQYQAVDSRGYDHGRSSRLYPEVTEEELALGLQQSLWVENLPPQDGIADRIFQPYPHFPPDYRAWDQHGYPQVSNEQFVNCEDNFWDLQGHCQYNSCNPQDADYECPDQAADHPNSRSPDGRPSRSSVICDVCKEHVPVDSGGHPEYREVPVFRQKFCSKHRNDGTARCFSCERFEPRGARFIHKSYSDGRKICVDCKKSAIMNRRDCQPLIDEIRKFYEDLDMKVWQEDIPIYMLDQHEMNRGRGGLVRGSTKPHEDPLTTMIQTPRFGPDNEIIGVEEVPFKLVSYRNVESIRLLNGCPRLYIGRTLAHEMMHAWTCLEGYQKSKTRHVQGFCGPIPNDLEEGVCQVMAHIWIESKIRNMSRNKSSSSPELQFERKLAEQIKHSIETDDRPDYGPGFRKVRHVVDKYGLKETLNYVRMTGSFPE